MAVGNSDEFSETTYSAIALVNVYVFGCLPCNILLHVPGFICKYVLVNYMPASTEFNLSVEDILLLQADM